MAAPLPFIHLPDTTDAPSAAREFAAAHSSTFIEAARDIIDLLVSEVVTNAYRHGRPPVRVAFTIIGTVVRVDVHDYGPVFSPPVIRPDDLRKVGGWGLGIVAALATSWGIAEESWDVGKRVWFELDTVGPFPALPGIVRS